MSDIIIRVHEGEVGPAGKSAYEIAMENGFQGTAQEWLESLKGPKGDPGEGTELEVVDNLESEDADKALSANQGRILGAAIASLTKQTLHANMVIDATKINLATNPKALTIPTYDLNPSAGHTNILYIPNGFRGYKYVLAYSPFPDESRENPCLVFSNDGENWVNADWCPNPLYTRAEAIADGLSYNSDPCVVLMHDGKLGVFWRGYKASPKREVIYLKTIGENDAEFSPAVKVIDTNVTVLSPAVVAEDDGTYTMYSVNSATTNAWQRVEKRTSPDCITWSDPVVCNLNTLGVVIPWHVSACKLSDGCAILIDSDMRNLHLYKSTDGVNFYGSSIPTIKTSSSGWDNRGYYGSGFLVLDEKPLRIWAFVNGMDGSGANEYADVWTIGSQIATKMPIYRNRDDGNLLVSPALSTDTDGDGVVDGWTAQVHAGMSGTFEVDEGAQKINITESTVNSSVKIKQTIDVVAGTAYKPTVVFKTSGNAIAQYGIDWYNGATYISTTGFATNSASDEFDLMDYGVTFTAPENATKAQINLMAKPNAIGDTGSVWFKEAVFVAVS